MLFVLLWQWLLVACIAWPVLSHEIRSFDEIHLITQYFHAVDRTRHEEYDYALCKNIANPFITSIHLLQSSKLASGEVFDEELFDICKPEWGIPRAAFNKVKLVHDDPSISERLKFSEAVSYALRNLPRELVIITDSDIYFDDSVQNLTNNPYVYYELAMLKRNYYLSRYEQVENSNFGTQCGPKFRGIHDAFVFSPSDAYNFLPDLTAFTFGTWGLANRVIYELQQQGRKWAVSLSNGY